MSFGKNLGDIFRAIPMGTRVNKYLGVLGPITLSNITHMYVKSGLLVCQCHDIDVILLNKFNQSAGSEWTPHAY